MTKQDLDFKSPILNAAGSLGFVPDPRGPINLQSLGAFFTNPISLSRRIPAKGPRLASFPAGFLLLPFPLGELLFVLGERFAGVERLVAASHGYQRPQAVSRSCGNLHG